MEEKEKEKGREERKKGEKEKEKGREERKKEEKEKEKGREGRKKEEKEKGKGREERKKEEKEGKRKRKKKKEESRQPTRHDVPPFFFLLNKNQVYPFRGNPLSGQRNPFKGGGVIRHPFGGLGLETGRKGVTLF
jgi:hypothetical protein